MFQEVGHRACQAHVAKEATVVQLSQLDDTGQRQKSRQQACKGSDLS